MLVIQLLALSFFIVTLVLIIVYGMILSRKIKSETDKIFASRFFIIWILTFAAGGITRAVQQNFDIEWLNGFVTIFAGLFLALCGAPFFWRIINNKVNGLKGFLLLLAGLLFTLLGLGIIYLGFTQN